MKIRILLLSLLSIFTLIGCGEENKNKTNSQISENKDATFNNEKAVNMPNLAKSSNTPTDSLK